MWNFCEQALHFNFTLAHVAATAEYLSRLEEAPADRIHPKMADLIPVHHIEIDLASQTTKRDGDEEEFDPDATPSPDSAETAHANAEDVNTVLMMVRQSDGDSNIDYQHRLKLILNQSNQHDFYTFSDV